MLKHKQLVTITLIIFTVIYLTINGLNPEDDKKIIGNQRGTNNTEVTSSNKDSISYVSVEEKGRLIWFTPVDITEVNASSKAKKIFESEEEFYSWRKSDEHKLWKEDNSQYLIFVKQSLPNEEAEKILTDKEEIALLKDELKRLKKEVKKTKKKLSTLKIDKNDLSKDFYEHLSKHKTIGVFNAKNLGGYQNIETNCGIFPIMIKDVKPYLEGHKITFSIGNPYSAEYEDYKIKITWLNDREKDDKQGFLFNAFYPGKKAVNQEFLLTKALLAGAWNDVECFVNPSTLDELESLEVSLNILGTSLSRK